jgi:hypothetical protein
MQREWPRLIVSVIVGYAAIGVLVGVTDYIAGMVIPRFSEMVTPPPSYFYTSVATDTLYSVVGGYICAMLARANSRRAVLALIILGEIIGLGSQIAFWKTVPHWFGLALLVTYPTAVWFGWKLRRPGKPIEPAYDI